MKDFCKLFTVGIGEKAKRQLLVMSTVNPENDFIVSINSVRDNGTYMQLNIPVESIDFSMFLLGKINQTQADLFFTMMLAMDSGIEEQINKHGVKLGNFLTACFQEYEQEKNKGEKPCNSKQLH